MRISKYFRSAIRSDNFDFPQQILNLVENVEFYEKLLSTKSCKINM